MGFRSVDDPARVARLCLVALATQGVSHVTTQLVLLREMLAVYSGNELVMGVLLGCWLGLTGLGAGLGRWASDARRPEHIVAQAGLAIAALPAATVSALRLFRNAAFVHGAEIDFFGTLLSSLVLFMPYCLVTGFCITVSAAVVGRARTAPRGVAAAFVADGLGDVLGGVLFGCVLVHVGNHYVTLLGVGVLVALGSTLLAGAAGNRGLAAAGTVVAVGLVALGLLVNLDRLTVASLYPGKQLLAHTSSLYGDLTVTRSSGQIDWFENGAPLASSRDVEHAEETVHFAMAQRPNAEHVLLVGGAVSGTAQQVLRYPVRRVDVVELDPELLALRARFRAADSDARLHFVQDDGRRYIRRTRERYDVVILDLPEPTTLQINRYYTREFLSEARRALTEGGVVSFAIGQYADYVSAALARQLAMARSTARLVFRRVLLIPTTRVFVLASDGSLTLDVGERLRARGIRTQWVNADMLEAVLTEDRLSEVNRAARAHAPANTDFAPALQSATVERWLGRFDLPPAHFLGGGLVLLLALIATLGRIPVALAATGFAAAGLEVLLLIGLQIACGAVYGAASLVIAGYMLGSTTGAWSSMRWLSRRAGTVPTGHKLSLAFAALVLGIGGFALGAPWMVAWLSNAQRAVTSAYGAFSGLGLLLGLLAGAAFPLAAASETKDAATSSARLFGADLWGAALGALLIGTLLLPMLGLRGASYVVSAVCCVGALAVLWPVFGLDRLTR